MGRGVASRLVEKLPHLRTEFQRAAAADSADRGVLDHPRLHQARLLLGTKQDDPLRPALRRHHFNLQCDRVRAVLRGEAIQFVQRDEVLQVLDLLGRLVLHDLVKYRGDHEALQRRRAVDAM